MAKTIFIFYFPYRTKYPKQHSTILLIFLLFTSLKFSSSQTSAAKCIIDIRLSSPENNSNDQPGSWGGFVCNNSCTVAFDEYLHALARRANQTGDIYLNSTEQRDCLLSMKRNGTDVLGCGIEKLTSGSGGCSDYSVIYVVNKLGVKFRNLQDDCKLVGEEIGSYRTCRVCLRSWEEIGRSPDEEGDSTNFDSDVCRFAALVSLISIRIADEKWVRAVFKCLGEQSISTALKQEGALPSKGRKSSTGQWILIAGLVGVAVIVTIAIWILFRKKNRKIFSTKKEASNGSVPEHSSCLKIPIKEVYTATNNLNASNFIGQGIAGKVYKGILSNGQPVAIKHILKNDGQVETFVREVRSLSHVRHPNLVALLGYCEKEDECFLVYELCHNGNLSEWLYGKDRVLSWIRRLEIAIDCARGLWFLHTYSGGCIVHRDIKPTNILLSGKFQAKLSDFGLSKVMDVGQSHVSSEVRGTFGYVDPEYRRNHHVNASGDVYSFGIVLLQLLSGQKVINLNANRPMPISKMAKSIMRGGKIEEFADPNLNREYSIEAFEFVMKLALSCTGLKQERPSMEQVVSKLEKALDISVQVSSVASFQVAVLD